MKTPFYFLLTRIESLYYTTTNLRLYVQRFVVVVVGCNRVFKQTIVTCTCSNVFTQR